MIARLLTTAALAATLLAGHLFGATPVTAGVGAAALPGTYLVTATFTDPADLGEVEVLITFMPGGGPNEGTLIDTNSFQLTPNPVCSPDQGVWRRNRNGVFVATHYNYCFDAENGYEPAGPTTIRDRFILGQGGETLTGKQYIEGFDTDGNLVFVARADLSGHRLHAQAPPR